MDSGLYKIVRCPNYFGEIIFWTGNFISGFNVYVGFSQWFITFLGYAGIVFVMFSGARRIEINQNQFYGKDEKYKEYAKRTNHLHLHEKYRSKIGYGKALSLFEDKKYNFNHKCSTEGGSSGSPILNMNNKLIGMHI